MIFRARLTALWTAPLIHGSIIAWTCTVCQRCPVCGNGTIAREQPKAALPLFEADEGA